MRRFQKKPEVTFAFIPGVGRVAAGTVLEGDQYAKFVPSLLVELAAGVPPEPPAKAEPPAVIIPPPPPTPVQSPSPQTLADAGFPSPEELEATVDSENKKADVQIEEPKKEVPKVKPGPSKKQGRK